MSIRYSTLSGFVRKCIVYAVLLVGFSGTAALAGEPAPDIEVFVRSGCPHCEAAKAFLKELQRERPAVRIAIYDVAEDSAARQRLAMLAAIQNPPSRAFMRECAASFRLRTSPGRWLKLAGGMVMAGLGAVLLLHPKWLI